MPSLLTSDDAKRLLMCMQLGLLVQHADGHRWISADGAAYPGDDTPGHEGWMEYGIEGAEPLNHQLRRAKKEPIRAKQYGSLRACFDEIDAALVSLGQPALLALYDAGGDAVWGLGRA